MAVDVDESRGDNQSSRIDNIVRLPEVDTADLARAGLEAERPYLLIHPGSGSREKCWPLDRFVEVARAAGPSAAFVLGPAELDRWDRRAVASLSEEFTTLTAPPLEVLAGALGGARAYVGNDSGPTHLAAAIGTPTVALFGPTDPAQFRPRGRHVSVIAKRTLGDIPVPAVLAELP